MKKQFFYQMVLLGLFVSFTVPAHACRVRERIHNEENANIASRNQQIGQLGAEAARLRQELAENNIRVEPTEIHEKSCDFDQESLHHAVATVGMAIQLLKATLITDFALQTELERIKKAIDQAAGWNLSAQLRLYAEGPRVQPALKVKLLEMANAIAMFELHSESWKKSSKEILESYLAGRITLSGAVVAKLEQDAQTIESDIRKKDQSCKDVRERAEKLRGAIKGANDRLVQIAQTTATLQAGNAASGARMAANPLCMLEVPRYYGSEYY